MSISSVMLVIGTVAVVGLTVSLTSTDADPLTESPSKKGDVTTRLTAVKICNSSPMNIHLAVGSETSEGIRTTGWKGLSAGDCVKGHHAGEAIYYYAVSFDPLAKWLNEGRSIAWYGRTDLCVRGKVPDLFSIDDHRDCDFKLGFIKKPLDGRSVRVDIYDKYHDYSEWSETARLEIAKDARRVLLGRMAFEKLVRAETGGRNYGFFLGFTGESAANGKAARVRDVYPGTPADNIGLASGDMIVALNGQPVRNMADLDAILSAVPLTRVQPLDIEVVVEAGAHLSGTVFPMFLPPVPGSFGSRSGSRIAALSHVDKLLFGRTSEMVCPVIHGLIGITSNLVAEDRPTLKEVARRSKRCIQQIDTMVFEHIVFRRDPEVARRYAELTVPIWQSKTVPAGTDIPLAARSRLVASTTVVPPMNRDLGGMP